jgi:hypothetical protein
MRAGRRQDKRWRHLLPASRFAFRGLPDRTYDGAASGRRHDRRRRYPPRRSRPASSVPGSARLEHYLRDLTATDKRQPTVNAFGPIYGATGLSTEGQKPMGYVWKSDSASHRGYRRAGPRSASRFGRDILSKARCAIPTEARCFGGLTSTCAPSQLANERGGCANRASRVKSETQHAASQCH